MDTAGSPSENNTANYRVLKAVVIILGTLILLALGALVAGLVLGLGPQGPADRAGEAYLSTLPASPGARIMHSELDGNRLLLRLEGGGSDVLIIVDVRNGREIGRVVLAPRP